MLKGFFLFLSFCLFVLVFNLLTGGFVCFWERKMNSNGKTFLKKKSVIVTLQINCAYQLTSGEIVNRRYAPYIKAELAIFYLLKNMFLTCISTL